MAKSGIRFSQFYAGTSVCAPSRAVLMTGMHTGHTGIRGNAKVPLAVEERTVAEFLKKGGYSTAAIGKWGLGNEGTTGVPSRKGFDEFFGYLDQTHAHAYYPEHLWRNDVKMLISENNDGKKKFYSHDFFTRAASNFIRHTTNTPFFLYLAYTIPHANNEMKEKGMEVPSDAP